MNTEQWREIPGYEGSYAVSDAGRVRSLSFRNRFTRAPRVREMKLTPLDGGYLGFAACCANRKRKMLVHRAVLLAFAGNPPPGMIAAHANGCPADNRLSNLRWATPSENARDKDRHGTAIRGEKNHQAKLSAANVHEIRRLGRSLSQRAIGRRFGVGPTAVAYIQSGKRWGHVALMATEEATP